MNLHLFVFAHVGNFFACLLRPQSSFSKIAITTVSSMTCLYGHEELSEFNSSAASWAAGFSFKKHFNETIGLQTEVLYDHKGSSDKGVLEDLYGDTSTAIVLACSLF